MSESTEVIQTLPLIKKTSDEERDNIRKEGAQFLVTNPTARGLTADQIRQRFYRSITGCNASLLKEQDRIVEEANAALVYLDGARADDRAAMEAALEAERQARADADAALDERITANGEDTAARVPVLGNGTERGVYVQSGSETRLYPLYDTDPTADGMPMIPMTDRNGRLHTASPKGGGDEAAVNLSYFNERVIPLEEKSAEHGTRITALSTQLSGNARSYVLTSFASLAELLSGRWETGEESYETEHLLTGDNLLIVEHGVPDFWFEATADTSRAAETYTYTPEGEEAATEYELRVMGYASGTQVGLLHILESDYTVIEGYSKSASASATDARASAEAAKESADALIPRYDAFVLEVRDAMTGMDAALDAILEIQKELIGEGETEEVEA